MSHSKESKANVKQSKPFYKKIWFLVLTFLVILVVCSLLIGHSATVTVDGKQVRVSCHPGQCSQVNKYGDPNTLKILATIGVRNIDSMPLKRTGNTVKISTDKKTYKQPINLTLTYSDNKLVGITDTDYPSIVYYTTTSGGVVAYPSTDKIAELKAANSEQEQTAAQKVQQAQNQATSSTSQSHIGTTVSDAGFNFVVNSIKCGETHLSTGGLVYYYSDAQGQYCRLNVTITNTGNTANSIDVSDQYVYNSQGQRYDYASDATATAAGDYVGTPLNDDINPGNSVTGDIVFDVPMGVTPTTAELHGDYGSLGVKTNLQ